MAANVYFPFAVSIRFLLLCQSWILGGEGRGLLSSAPGYAYMYADPWKSRQVGVFDVGKVELFSSALHYLSKDLKHTLLQLLYATTSCLDAVVTLPIAVLQTKTPVSIGLYCCPLGGCA